MILSQIINKPQHYYCQITKSETTFQGNQSHLFVSVGGLVGSDERNFEVGDEQVSRDSLLAIRVWCKPQGVFCLTDHLFACANKT